jgi:hypothetical protein
MRARLLVVLTLVGACSLLSPARATMLWPELKAYDFARAYYLEDGGLTLVPQDGFYCPSATQTPEGLHLAPGTTFVQFDPARQIEEIYTFERIDKDEHRGYFHERRYRYSVAHEAGGKTRHVRQNFIDETDFYLTRWRALEWFDFAVPYTELHPGEQLWRTRP